jgi:hypothetical protein
MSELKLRPPSLIYEMGQDHNFRIFAGASVEILQAANGAAFRMTSYR